MVAIMSGECDEKTSQPITGDGVDPVLTGGNEDPENNRNHLLPLRSASPSHSWQKYIAISLALAGAASLILRMSGSGAGHLEFFLSSACLGAGIIWLLKIGIN